METNKQPELLDAQRFIQQLKLLNVPTPFKNTCEYLLNTSAQQNQLNENLLLSLMCLMKDGKKTEFKIMRKDVENIEGFIDLDITNEYVAFKIVEESIGNIIK